MAKTITLDDLHGTFGRDLAKRRWSQPWPGCWNLDGYPIRIEFVGYDSDLDPFVLHIGRREETYDLLVDAMRRGNARATEIDLGELESCA